MLYTLTLDPALDRMIDVEEFIYDDVNGIIEEKKTASGKGIDVSRVINELGRQSIALGFVGGYNGLEVEGRLVNEGLLCDFVRIAGETRTNIIIHQRRKKMQTLLSASLPEVSPIEVATLFNKIKDIPRESYLAVSGGVTPGITENFYAQIITTLREKNVRVVLDADGEELKKGVHARPFLIKPNIHEFGRLVERSVKEVEEIPELALPYLDLVDYIIVSAGVRGMVGLSKTEKFYAVPPKVNVKSSLGAGDSAVGGIMYALREGADFREVLSFGVACGTAATLSAAHALCSRDDVHRIKNEVVINNI